MWPTAIIYNVQLFEKLFLLPKIAIIIWKIEARFQSIYKQFEPCHDFSLPPHHIQVVCVLVEEVEHQK